MLMSEFTTLKARDGHELRAWLATPKGTPKGALVVIQEIFGVNSHIRAVTDGFAAEGYLAIAPSVFDRVQPGVELGYDEQTMQEGFGYVKQLKLDETLMDLSAAIGAVKHAGRVGVVGYCWGGTMAYVAACELPISCAVAYYGGSIVNHLDRKPKVPVMYHFGENDKHITPEHRAKIAAAHPQGIYHLYPADHGFNCDQRGSYEPQSAALARQRTLEFFGGCVAGNSNK
jgi:carboxymethylenebutenolidase